MPKYDLEALWKEHGRYEFETRDFDTASHRGDMVHIRLIDHCRHGSGETIERIVSHRSLHVWNGSWSCENSRPQRARSFLCFNMARLFLPTLPVFVLSELA